MTTAVAVVLVVAAVLIWPTSRGSARVSSGASEGDGAAVGAEGVASGAGGWAHGAAGPGGRSARVTVDAAADALVLTALALQAGLAPVEALEAVAAEVPEAVGHHLRVVASAQRWGQDAATAWTHVGDAWRPAALAWQAAERSGAAPAGVVLAAADRMRHQEASRVESAVQRAGVLLVLPLGVCFLPGFAATTVVPVVLHLTRTALGGS